jgi:AAA+ ATPase superfamily predicted ATPase
MKTFVGRQRELGALVERLGGPRSFVLLYGQRRSGKTFLLQKLLGRDQDCLFFTADETTARMSLDRFVHEAVEAGRLDPALEAAAAADWGSALTLLLQQSALLGRRLVLVLDECQYLLDREPALASVLQRLWDQHSQRLPLHLILCGSALRTMASLGDSNQPLHGRFDLKLHLQPFGYLDTAAFVPRWAAADRLRLYGVFGGLARHLAYLDPSQDLAANTCRTILDPLGPLHWAPQDMLRAERISVPAEAAAVLAALAQGENRFNAVASRTGLPAPRLDLVLRELSALDLVQRDLRFGDHEGSKFVHHRCQDPFLAFWFRFVRPNGTALEGRTPAAVFQQRVAPQLDQHLGSVFETVVRQAVLAGALASRLGPIDEVGSFWSRDGQTQVDLVARSGHRLAFVECKWRADTEVTQAALTQLREHAQRARLWSADSLAVIASAGRFSAGLRRLAGAGEVMLLGLADLLRRPDSEVGGAGGAGGEGGEGAPAPQANSVQEVTQRYRRQSR